MPITQAITVTFKEDLMKPGANLFEEDMSIKVEFPFTVTKDIIDKLIKKTNALNASFSHLYT